jgi:hypothetical protein
VSTDNESEIRVGCAGRTLKADTGPHIIKLPAYLTAPDTPIELAPHSPQTHRPVAENCDADSVSLIALRDFGPFLIPTSELICAGLNMSHDQLTQGPGLPGL